MGILKLSERGLVHELSHASDNTDALRVCVDDVVEPVALVWGADERGSKMKVSNGVNKKRAAFSCLLRGNYAGIYCSTTSVYPVWSRGTSPYAPNAVFSNCRGFTRRFTDDELGVLQGCSFMRFSARNGSTISGPVWGGATWRLYDLCADALGNYYAHALNYDEQARYVWKITTDGARNSKDWEFVLTDADDVLSIDADAAGNVYAVASYDEQATQLLYALSTGGAARWSFAPASQRLGRALCITSLVYVADPSTGTLYQLSAVDGSVLNSIAGQGIDEVMAVASDGRCAVRRIVGVQHHLTVYSQAGEAEFDDGGKPLARAPLNGAFDTRGYLWMVYNLSSRFRRFNRAYEIVHFGLTSTEWLATWPCAW